LACPKPAHQRQQQKTPRIKRIRKRTAAEKKSTVSLLRLNLEKIGSDTAEKVRNKSRERKRERMFRTLPPPKAATDESPHRPETVSSTLFPGSSRSFAVVSLVPVCFDFNACVVVAFSAFLCRRRSRPEPTPVTTPSPSLPALDVVENIFFLVFGAGVIADLLAVLVEVILDVVVLRIACRR
jgi:hypothetical protein